MAIHVGSAGRRSSSGRDWQQRIFSGRDVPPPEFEMDDGVVYMPMIGLLSPRRMQVEFTLAAAPRLGEEVEKLRPIAVARFAHSLSAR